MKNKKLCSLILAIILMFNMSAVLPIEVFAEIGSHTYAYDNYEVDYAVLNEWEGNQSIQVTIRNIGTESILNWALAYRAGGEVNGLWNAVSPKENIIKNAGYNYEIEPSGSVSFGYTLAGENLELPEKFEIVSKRANVTDGYEVQFDIYDDWGDGFQGAVTVTNTGNEPLEAWTLSFDTNFIISNSWGGRIIDSTENSYTIASEMWTNPIMPNSSSSFGFTATKQADTEAAATNFVLTSVKIDENTITEEAAITAEAAYNSENNAVSIMWLSTVPTGAFEVMTSLDGVNFETVATVENVAFYEYAVNSGFGVLYVKVCQNIDGNVVESNVVTVTENIEDIDYELDTDKDGLPDYYEDILGTDKNKVDTDGDGLSDGYEVLYLGTDPLKADTDDNGINDGDEDFDNDGLTNAQECELGTDPNTADTDGDGLNDGAEVNIHGTDPLKYDTDGDKVSDGDEIALGLNPNSTATDGTPDNERTFSQIVSSDSEVLSAVNDDNDTPFKVSLEMKSAGVAENNVYARESGYSNAIKNSAIIGIAPEFVYTDGLAVEEVTVKFELENSVINNTLGTYTDESDEFKGIKRLNVFMFFEDVNMLLPIETFHDEATNTVYTKTDIMGTYCLVDMELWLDALKVPANTSISEKMEVIENRAVLQNSLDIDINSVYNENEVNLNQNDELRDGFNLVFIIDTRSTKTYDEFKLMKDRILDISRTVLKNSPNARIYFMNQNTSLTSDVHYYFYSDLYGELIENADGNKLSCNYFTDYTHIERESSAFTRTQSENSKIVLSDALVGIKEECDLTRETFVFSIFNQEGVTYRHSYKDNEAIEDKDGKDILDKLVEKNANISVIAEIDDSKKYGYAHDMYKKSGGKLFSDQYDYTEDVIKHIYGKKVNKEENTKEYWMILSTGLEYVQLDDTVSNIYFKHGKKGIKQSDTDKDGLTDYEEINFDCKLIKFNNGFVELPTYGECVDYKAELTYVSQGLFRFDGHTVTNMSFIDYIDSCGIVVLPIRSDPTSADGDLDGCNDIADSAPLRRNVNIDESTANNVIELLNNYLNDIMPPKYNEQGEEITSKNKECSTTWDFFGEKIWPTLLLDNRVSPDEKYAAYVSWLRQAYGIYGIEKFWLKTDMYINILYYEIIDKETFWKALKQIGGGNFSDEVTITGTAGQIVLSFSGIDFVADIRDVAYDLTHWEWSWSHAGQTGLDMIGILPIVGALKNSDELAALSKLSKLDAVDALDDSIDSINALLKSGKRIDEITEIEKLSLINKLNKLAEADIIKIAEKYKNLQCVECADDIQDSLMKIGLNGKRIMLTYGDYYILHDLYSATEAISENGKHTAILFNNKVYDNLFPKGINYDDWLNGFVAIDGEKIVEVIDF